MSYKSTDITRASHPKEWALIMLAFPGYKKRKAVMIETESTSLTGRYWSDGSKDNYVTINANGCKGLSKVCDRHDYPFTAPDAEVDLMDGTQVVQCGVFCGRPGQAYLYTKPKSWDQHPCDVLEELGIKVPKELREYCDEDCEATQTTE